MKDKQENRGAWVEAIIKDFINLSPENTLKNAGNEKAWADPLVGFSRGDDPLYQSYKEHVGPFHWTPLEVFSLAFPKSEVIAGELTVISWILPQTEETKESLRKETVQPSDAWARARIFGEEVNVKLRQHVVDTLRAAGVDAVAPMLFPQWKMTMSERFGFASTWSERHAAYAAGLGTFSLCDGLITPVGKAMTNRIGCGPAPDTAHSPSVHRSPCILPFLHARELRQMHRPVPRRRREQVRPRQGEMHGLPAGDKDLCHVPLWVRRLRLRLLPIRSALRVPHPCFNRRAGEAIGVCLV